jgi:hypothetical protein
MEITMATSTQTVTVDNQVPTIATLTAISVQTREFVPMTVLN